MKRKKTVKKALFRAPGKCLSWSGFERPPKWLKKMSHKINRAKLGKKKRSGYLWVKVKAGAEQSEVRTGTIPRTLESVRLNQKSNRLEKKQNHLTKLIIYKLHSVLWAAERSAGERAIPERGEQRNDRARAKHLKQ